MWKGGGSPKGFAPLSFPPLLRLVLLGCSCVGQHLLFRSWTEESTPLKQVCPPCYNPKLLRRVRLALLAAACVRLHVFEGSRTEESTRPQKHLPAWADRQNSCAAEELVFLVFAPLRRTIFLHSGAMPWEKENSLLLVGNAELFRLAVLLTFFEAGQGKRAQHPPPKKLMPFQTKN